MKLFSFYGFNEFIVCCGYKGFTIKEYFANYFLHQADVTIDLANNKIDIHRSKAEPWKITLVDTGLNTMTGGRILRIKEYVENETFLLTYGDGVSNVNINELIKFHQNRGKLATLTAVQPSGRFGALAIDNHSNITSFTEKPQGDGAWINGGFFVLEKEILNYILDGDSTIWERAPLEKLTTDHQLNAFKHKGFWKPMDTLRDKIELEKLWSEPNCPWKLWE